jgi:DNA-binding GntR family transcriptional regulator
VSDCKIELECLTENEDGSVNAQLYMDADSAKYLISYGFLHMLREAIKEGKAVKAEQLMKAHLLCAKNRLIKFINKSL